MQYLRIFGFRVYLQRYPKFYVQQIIDQSYALTLSAGCLVLRAEPVLDFSQALYLDSLAEISFAEGDIERCTALWREAASKISTANRLKLAGILYICSIV